MRTVGQILTRLMVVVAVLEILSALLLRVTGQWPSNSFQAEYRTQIWQTLPPGLGPFQPLRPHPYFGHLRDKTLDTATNNYGFTEREDFPYPRKPDDYVIGVFGGSVAYQLTEYIKSRQSLEALSQFVFGGGQRKVVVLNFSLPGGEQPQQYLTASYFMKELDLVINVEGSNELLWQSPNYPSDFPSSYHFLYGAGVPATWEHAMVSLSRDVLSRLSQVPETIRVLKLSPTFYLLWKLVLNLKDYSIQTVEQRAWPRRETNRPFVDISSQLSSRKLSQYLVHRWVHWTRLQNGVAQALGRPAIFFIIPMPHLKPHKPFSDEEKKIALTHPLLSKIQPEIQLRYEQLRESISELKKDQIQVVDLSSAFNKTNEVVYSDNLGHLNEAGHRILAQNIFASLRTRLPAAKKPFQAGQSKRSTPK